MIDSSSLDSRIKDAKEKAEKFKKLKEEHSKGNYLRGFYANDFYELKNGMGLPINYLKEKGIQIPQDMIEEATQILEIKDKLGFSSGVCGGPNNEQRKQNPQAYVSLFERCEILERRLYELLSSNR